jgi:TPR repeat protein
MTRYRFVAIVAAALSLAAGAARADYQAGEAAFRARNFGAAYLLLLPEAQSGNAAAQFMVAQMSDNGLGRTQPDPQEAFRWFRHAAAQGHPVAQYMLARAYAAGRGVAADQDESVVWMTRAAEGRFVPAILLMAQMAHSGPAARRDLAAAAQWYRRGAELGSPRAAHQLGERLLRGEGVAAVAVEGWQWLRLAAALGYPMAMIRIAEAAAAPRASSATRIEGMMMALVAQRSAPADRRADLTRIQAELTGNLLPDELAEARRRAQAWRAPPGVDDVDGVAPAPPRQAQRGNQRNQRGQNRAAQQR